MDVIGFCLPSPRQGTSITDSGLKALEKGCLSLRMVRVDSCRSVSREMRQMYNERSRNHVLNNELNEYERIAIERQRAEDLAKVLSSSESEGGGSDEDYSSESS